ncbi:unnamed protein product [Closterium sp. NIES-65]|nr:unnamed protein product [Closterium sp. NIES-65]
MPLPSLPIPAALASPARRVPPLPRLPPSPRGSPSPPPPPVDLAFPLPSTSLSPSRRPRFPPPVGLAFPLPSPSFSLPIARRVDLSSPTCRCVNIVLIPAADVFVERPLFFALASFLRRPCPFPSLAPTPCSWCSPLFTPFPHAHPHPLAHSALACGPHHDVRPPSHTRHASPRTLPS